MNKDIFVVIEHLNGQVSELSFTMLAAARALRGDLGGRAIALLFGHEAENLAHDLFADEVWYDDHPALAEFNPQAYQRVLFDLMSTHQPRLILFGDTSFGAELSAAVSMQMGLPLVSACREIQIEAERVLTLSQICGGRMMVESESSDPVAVIAMIPGGYRSEDGHAVDHPKLVELPTPQLEGLTIEMLEIIQPDTSDVDISNEEILVAVGRGIQNEDNLEFAQELAEALGGVVCASRPVVDQGWLPISRLVGKSGKRVKPKLYLTLGISGAPEHVEAISDAEIVIAINTDPAAPIYNIARYGYEGDLLDFTPIFTEKILNAKSTPAFGSG